MRVLNTDEDIAMMVSNLSYMIIKGRDMDEIHETLTNVMRASTIGRDSFFEASQLAWNAMNNGGLEFFTKSPSRSEIITLMETN